MRQLQGNKSHQGKKSIIIPILLFTLTISLSGCDLWEGVKWIIGVVNYGRIEGTVTDIEGNAIEGMTITAYPTGVGTRPAPESAETDSEGKYTLDLVPPGVHKIEGRKDNHEICSYSELSVIESQATVANIENVMRVDINEWYTSGTEGFNITSIGSGEYYAQSFKPSVDTIRKVEFYTSSSDSEGTIEIRADSSGNPGDILISGDITSVNNVHKLILDNSVSVTPGETYWMVIYSDEYIARCLILTTDTYADGEVKYSSDGTVWTIPEGIADIMFSTFY